MTFEQKNEKCHKDNTGDDSIPEEKKCHEDKKRRAPRNRNWVFTDFQMIDIPSLYEENHDIIRFVGWGQEICPKTGKNHQQGWIQMINPKTLRTMKKLLGRKAHLEAMIGTEDDSQKYCSKEGSYKQLGTFIRMGQRTDLEQIKKRLNDGEELFEIAQDHFGDCIRYQSGLRWYQGEVNERQAPEWRDVRVIVHKGPTGTGKTKHASKETDYTIHGERLKWWQGYRGQEKILIDEYANQLSLPELLGLLDGYKLRLEIKGSHTYARWKEIHITTNLGKLHENAKPEHRAALYRRIDEIWCYNEVGEKHNVKMDDNEWEFGWNYMGESSMPEYIEDDRYS